MKRLGQAWDSGGSMRAAATYPHPAASRPPSPASQAGEGLSARQVSSPRLAAWRRAPSPARKERVRVSRGVCRSLPVKSASRLGETALQLPPNAGLDEGLRESAWRDAGHPDRREILCPADAAPLHQDLYRLADLGAEMARPGLVRGAAQPRRAFTADVAWDLRHALGRRSRPRRERKDMGPRQPAFFDEAQRALEHRFRLGRKADDEIRRKGRFRTAQADILAEADRVPSRMPAFHALQDHVVARLQRQMEMRHQPLLLGDGSNEIGVDLDRVDRGEAEPL